jgi:hypothetical protein
MEVWQSSKHFRNEDTGYQLSSISAPDNHRYFQKLKEDELAANASYDYKFNKNETGDYQGKSLWFKWKNQVKRISTQFNLKANSGSTNTVVDPNNLDLFYNQNNFSNGAFLLPLSVETLKF